jgi:glycosyltransferase involved in cell wall biosynthesis
MKSGVQSIAVEETVGGKRGSVIVCIAATDEGTRDVVVRQVLTSTSCVIEHTDVSTQILIVVSKAIADSVTEEIQVRLKARAVLVLALEATANDVDMVNTAIRVTSPADVVVLAAGTRVYERWLEHLRAAALSDSTIASSTPLFQGVDVGKSFSADHKNEDCLSYAKTFNLSSIQDEQGSIDNPSEAANKIGEQSLALRPRIGTMGPDCVYLRRQALDLAETLDRSCSLNEALDRMAMRMVSLGMTHVAADNVIVGAAAQSHAGGGLLPKAKNPVQEVIANDEQGPLCRTTMATDAMLHPVSVTIDGRSLTSASGGTQTYVTGLILALAREPRLLLRVLIPPDLSERARETLATVPDIELLTYEQALKGSPLTDVVHRPQQIFTPDDLTLLRLLGKRVLVSQQDLISYHNYSYHSDLDNWRGYRRTTRLALAGADQVIFFSKHARRDALAEDLVSEARAHVVGIGSEHAKTSDGPAAGPAKLDPSVPFLLCLGADYAHKNRPFAIELLRALRDLGWRGCLVLAGAHVPYGSSSADEQELLSRYPELAASVIDLGSVDELTKHWLYEHARALVYPTLYEGFGLLPFEVASWKLPCLFAAQASLAEIASDAATLVAWDASASAQAVLPLMIDGSTRDRHITQLQALHAPTWEEIAGRMLAVYELAIVEPSSPSAPRAWQELEREHYIVMLDKDIRDLKGVAHEYQHAYHSLAARVETGLPLIDDGGLLSRAQQRGLMRIAARRGLGALALAPFSLLGRLGSTRKADSSHLLDVKHPDQVHSQTRCK